MNNTRYSYNHIGDFIQDESFIAVAKNRFLLADEWEKLICANPDKQALMEDASLLVNFLKLKPAQITEETIADELLKLQNKIKFAKRRKFVVSWFSIAASLLLAFLGGKFLISDKNISINDNEKIELLSQMELDERLIMLNIGDGQLICIDKNRTIIKQQEDGGISVNNGKIQISSNDIAANNISLSVPYGKLLQLCLNDGSSVWVNSGTKLIFPKKFDDKERKLYVEGEVYAEVKPDESRPFFVKTDRVEVKVLGTSFNLNSYQDNTFSEVVLVNGKVEVNVNNKINELAPGEYLKAESNHISISQGVDADVYTCWKDDVIRLNGEPLSVLLKKIARRYNTNLLFEGKDVATNSGGKIVLTDSVTDVLNALSLIDPVVFKVKKDSIIVSCKNIKK